MGISEDAPPLQEDVKPDIKPDVRNPHEEAIEQEEKAKAMMSGWLTAVKREDEDVKDELVDINGKPKSKGRTLVVMGTYSIGKERIVKGMSTSSPRRRRADEIAVAKALGSKIYCDPRKKGILLCQTDPELHSMIGTDPFQVCPQ